MKKEERSSIAVLKDLKVGQRVVIGYAKGVVYNNSYAIINVAGGSVRASHYNTVNTGAARSIKTLSRRPIHNVMIFTENGIVTLRGAVNSEAEKQSVAEKAATATSKDKIVNELEVKP